MTKDKQPAAKPIADDQLDPVTGGAGGVRVALGDVNGDGVAAPKTGQTKFAPASGKPGG